MSISTKTTAIVVNDKTTYEEKTIALLTEAMRLSHRLDAGRHYLMSTKQKDVTIEDALDAFGYNENGFEKT